MNSREVKQEPRGRPITINPRFGASLLWLAYAFRPHGADMHRPILLSVYGSDIAWRLRRIQAHAGRDGSNGWLVVALRGRRPAYVRGHFADRDMLLLEAVPGAYPPVAGKTRLPPGALQEELKNAGYWSDGEGRAVFKYKITSDSAVWGGAASAMLHPLIEIFGARATARIDVIAPLVPERDEAAIQREMRAL